MPRGIYPRKNKKQKQLRKFTDFSVKTLQQDLASMKTLPIVDMVNYPPHYTFGKFDVLAVLLDWFPVDPLLWQVCKYLVRANHKGNKIQDLEKAEFYLKKAISAEKSVQ